MKNSAVRYLACILGAWATAWGMASSFPAFAALHPPSNTKIESHRGVNLALNNPAHTRLGNWGHEFILENEEGLVTGASAATDLERSQTIAVLDPVTLQRTALPVHVGMPHSTSFAEPRFLRYRRLLN
ncbi:MAG: hypothetical protein ACYC9K_09570 [Sulfuricaulis sp.]